MKNMRSNLILQTDSYKQSHWMLYPEGMTNLYSYIESRGSDQPFFKGNTVMFGLQAILKNNFIGNRVTAQDVDQAKRYIDRHMGPGVFNYDGWMYIVNEHEGKLPLRIRGIKEGTVLPWSNALVTVEATDEKCAWLVSWFEPLLLQLWYPITVATLSYEIKQILKKFWSETVDDSNMSGIEFALHDFGFRGASSSASAEIGGMAHLINFLGTDTECAISAAYDLYGLDEEDDDSMPGFSVIASEHTVMCSNSDADSRDDFGAAKRMVDTLVKRGEGAIVAAVADTYDVFRFAEQYIGKDLKEKIQQSGGRLVLRPDSGDPRVIPIQIIEKALECFGYTVNSKGYKVLPDCIRILQGDGVNATTIEDILIELKNRKIAAENIVFGVGGALLQHCDRDWLKFAMKASARQTTNGQWIDVFKDPITDSRKTSKRGRLTTYKDSDGKYFTDRIELADLPGRYNDQLVTYFENGMLIHEETFVEIRQRLATQ